MWFTHIFHDFVQVACKFDQTSSKTDRQRVRLEDYRRPFLFFKKIKGKKSFENSKKPLLTERS